MISVSSRSRERDSAVPAVKSVKLQLLDNAVADATGYVGGALVPFGRLMRPRGLHHIHNRRVRNFSRALPEREVVFVRGATSQRQRIMAAGAIDPRSQTPNERTAVLYELQTIALAIFTELDAIGSDALVLPIGASRGGLPTVTVDQRTGKRIGLHLDTWNGLRADERRQARARASLNFGPGYRWFAFSPVLMTDMQVDGSSAVVCNGPELFERSLLRETYVMRLAPGEGYIARTDIIVHDASTLWDARPSRFIHVLSFMD